MEKLTKEETVGYFKQQFLNRWNPTLKVDTVIAEIAIEHKYSFSYVRKLLQPISELKSVKAYIVGEILELMERNIKDDRLMFEYPLNHIYSTLAPAEDDQVITDPIMCVLIEKMLNDENL